MITDSMNERELFSEVYRQLRDVKSLTSACIATTKGGYGLCCLIAHNKAATDFLKNKVMMCIREKLKLMMGDDKTGFFLQHY